MRAIYLKQKLFWNDGSPIIPINREAGSAAREAFSQKLFGQDSRRLATYWNQRYFEAGEFPPATLASEEAVMRFVAGNENAIGYVLHDDVTENVAVVLVLPVMPAPIAVLRARAEGDAALTAPPCRWRGAFRQDSDRHRGLLGVARRPRPLRGDPPHRRRCGARRARLSIALRSELLRVCAKRSKIHSRVVTSPRTPSGSSSSASTRI